MSTDNTVSRGGRASGILGAGRAAAALTALVLDCLGIDVLARGAKTGVVVVVVVELGND